ncbi:hypothetical protein [uncultured Nitrosomonas sp.]|uniref:hypothetical protein n=1 Tax=uncultured Nitrosomonas sp. TaxID=156424 RepID=UPI0025D806F7|nr:hypothetical protein [uncultured Nitrosomonas sp.]
MTNHNKIKFISGSVIAAVIATIGHNALAHTRLEVPEVSEGVRITNNVVIGHGCGEINVMGTSVVFPDGVDSTITVDGQPHTGELTEFVQNWGNLNTKIYSKAVFTFQDEKLDANGNASGFWAGGGDSLPHHMAGFIPFRTSAALIEPASCASSVKFYISIADICEITPASGFNENTVNLWTPNNLGTAYDRVSTTDDGPASLTIMRNEETNPLPESCGGTGQVVEVKPSAAQINRDMPIIFNGNQVWPQ